jgi:hypothetical protein
VVLCNKFTRGNGVKRAKKSESEKFQTSSKVVLRKINLGFGRSYKIWKPFGCIDMEESGVLRILF